MTIKLNKIIISSIIFTALLLLLIGCGRNSVTGNGNIVTKKIELESFKEIHVSGVFDVIVEKSDAPHVKITTDENLIEYIDISNNSDNLKISVNNKYSLSPTNKITIYVRFVDLTRIVTSGVIKQSLNNIAGDNLNIEVSGACSLSANNLNFKQLELTASGSSDLTLVGQTDKAVYNLSGSSNLLAKNLKADVVELNSSGSSSVLVFAKDNLLINSSGSSSITYFGSPGKIDQKLSGFSSVSQG